MSFDKNTQPKEDGFRFTPEQAFQLFKERIATQEEKEKQNKKLKWSIVCSSVALGIILSVALIICLFISPRLVNTAQKVFGWKFLWAQQVALCSQMAVLRTSMRILI